MESSLFYFPSLFWSERGWIKRHGWWVGMPLSLAGSQRQNFIAKNKKKGINWIELENDKMAFIVTTIHIVTQISSPYTLNNTVDTRKNQRRILCTCDNGRLLRTFRIGGTAPRIVHGGKKVCINKLSDQIFVHCRFLLHQILQKKWKEGKVVAGFFVLEMCEKRTHVPVI